MTNEEANLMEGDILTEEAVQETPQKTASLNIPKRQLPKIDPKVLKAKLESLKKLKPVTLVLIFIALILSFTLLVIFGSKTPDNGVVDPDILITSPEPATKEKKELTELEKNLNTYEEKVNNLSDSIKNYPPPKVDLDVKF